MLALSASVHGKLLALHSSTVGAAKWSGSHCQETEYLDGISIRLDIRNALVLWEKQHYPYCRTGFRGKVRLMKKAHIETSQGEIVLELFEDDAPGTVANFVGLAQGSKEWTDPKTGQRVKRPYYDGLTFHRVIDDFMIQGGCPLGNGSGGPGYTIKDELNGVRQKHLRGSLSMAKTAAPDSGGSQFFICHSPQPHLDRKHTVFGQVVSGIEVVDKIRKGDQMTRVWIEG
jgi:peptidyl-prolyl cis-trans isomerase B (cyclophilin B)